MPNDRLSMPFGTLNPVEESSIGRHIDPKNTQATDIIREAARGIFKKDTLNNSGAFKGIVLRIENNPNDVESNSWISNIFRTEKKISLKAFKIRIPEIHAALPEPSKYGSEPGSHQKIIDLYPTFISSTQKISDAPVAVGDIVFCDFANRENLSHPVYLGAIFNGPSPGAVGQNSAKNAFANGGGFCASPPAGDILFGSKNISSQLPINNACKNGPDQLNNSSKSKKDKAAEDAHMIESILGAMPSIRRFEDKWTNGSNLGPIELIELFPPFSSKSGVFIAKDQANFFYALREAAKRAGISIVLNSGFRSYDQQKYFYDGYIAGLPGFNKAAKAGYSNHQSGIAFDIKTGGPQSDIYVWLSKNAHKFGFINSGRKFKKQREYWHWEFRGEKSPDVIAEGKLSFEQKQSVFFT